MKLDRPRRRDEAPKPEPPVIAPAAKPEPAAKAAASGAITPETPMRGVGDLSLAAWRKVFAANGSPIAGDDLAACYEAAKGYTLLAAAQAERESGWGKTPPAQHNPLGLKTQDNRAFIGFDRWADAFASYKRRMSDPTYKGGVYQPQDIALREFFLAYVGGEQCRQTNGKTCANGETRESITAYMNAAIARLNGLKSLDGGNPAPAAANVLGTMIPWPKEFYRKIVGKPPSGNGWDALGDRRGQMLGTVDHITDGDNTPEEIVTLFGPGGGRYHDALTEAVIGRNGVGYLMNDPWSDKPMEGSGRTPWASGPANGLEGPGIPFVQQFGANAANHRMFATEHCGKAGWRLTDAQLDLSCRVHAVVITREGIPWEEWPYNKKAGRGLMVALEHRHISTKSCPAWDQAQSQAIIDGTRAEAKKLQGGGASPAGPAPQPGDISAPAVFPLGLSAEEVAAFWGANGGLKRDDGEVFQFDPTASGAISAMWLARARETGQFPAALRWESLPGGAEAISFGVPGDLAWVLYLPTRDGRSDWRWIDGSEA